MLFNSEIFLQFFAAFLLLYYMVRRHLPARNWLIIAASYLFYGWWDYRFLSLLLFSSLVDFGVGIGLEKLTKPRSRKLLLGLSVCSNLTILGFFKYFGFFTESLADLLGRLGLQVQIRTLEIILPVGISFYTFQTMSYTLDVYRRKMNATRELAEFLAFVSFFPQLVAGPIERGWHLLPQFSKTLRISRSMLEEGIWLCIWGMYKKVVLADNLAPLVEMVYDHPRPGSAMVMLATVAFAFQIYCDFSGYSDIARGTARMLGFDIMLNFNLPYVAVNVREFWARWHISLSTWLRDYLYISLGGNRGSLAKTCRNLLATMLLGGLWHGAAWNFVLWGAWHGAGLVIHRLWIEWRRGRDAPDAAAPMLDIRRASPRFLPNLAGWALTLTFVLYGWLLFRAGSVGQIALLTRALGDFVLPPWHASYCLNLAVFTLPLVAVQIWQHKTNDLLAPLRLPVWARTLLQGALVTAILLFWGQGDAPFIYFQF